LFPLQNRTAQQRRGSTGDDEKEDKEDEFGFLFISVGDCKAFRFRPNSNRPSLSSSLTPQPPSTPRLGLSVPSSKAEDLTFHSREGSLSESDCGGRLGPFLDGNLPDLRNLSLRHVTCRRDDLLILVSDGVHDNLDPYQMGLAPCDPSVGGPQVTKWDQLDGMDVGPDGPEGLKARFRERKLASLISSLPPNDRVSPKAVVARLLRHCIEVNSRATRWMIENPFKRIPTNYVDYPGKMDHTTCICVRVGADSL